jgi:hypothetical protein
MKLTRKLSKTKESQFPRKARAECQSVKDVPSQYLALQRVHQVIVGRTKPKLGVHEQ